MSSRLNAKGEWSEEHLEECRQLGISPNAHPEILALPVAHYPVGQEIPFKLRPENQKPATANPETKT